MIVSDKKTEAYLNRPADISVLKSLCREGVLSAFSFLRGASLCRSAEKWQELCTTAFSVLAYTGLSVAVFFLVVANWGEMYALSGGITVTGILVLCAFLRLYAEAEYAGALLIGFLIFLPDMIFGTDVLLYEQLGLWFFLSVFWSVPSKRTGIRSIPYIILNAALISYGLQFALPFFEMEVETFCAFAAVLNLLFLSGREALLKRAPMFDDPVFRFMPLCFSAFFLILGIVAQMFFGSGRISFVYGFVYMIFVGGMIFRGKYGFEIYKLFSGFIFCWTSLLLYCVVGDLKLRHQAFLSVWVCAESLLIVLMFVLNGKYIFTAEEKTDVD